MLAGLLALWTGWISTPKDYDKLIITSFLLGGIAPVMWIDTIIMAGFSVIKVIPKMIRIFGKSLRGSILLGIIVLYLCFVLSPFASNPIPHRIDMSITLVATIILLWLQPPFSLFLGASTPDSKKALKVVSLGFYPLRVVAMLDNRRTGYFIGSFSTLTDNIRTVSDHEWRDIIKDMADSVHSIVVDARTESENVVEEVGMIYSSPDLLCKTIFIIGIDGEAPALAKNKININTPEVQTTNQEVLGSFLTRWFLRR